MKKSLIFIVCLIIYLSACGPSEAAIQTAIAKTDSAKLLTAIPTSIALIQASSQTFTNTPAITDTSIPTMTPTLTETPTPTKTLTPTYTLTFTPTSSSTSTPLAPNELTATSIVMTRTAQSAFASQTQAARSLSGTQTQEARNLAATSTRQAKMATATFVAQYKEINWQELVTYPDKHTGEKVIVRGRVFNVNSDTEFQIFLSGTYEAAYIVMSNAYSGIFEEQAITVYGTVGGKNCGTNAYGAEICQPLIYGDWYTKP
jgi:uncharacterized membrane protein YcgQ (UPF0703/DUF1980 family)